MSTDVFGHLATGALLGSVLVASLASWTGLRDAARARVAAWTCLATAVALVVLIVSAYLAMMSAVYADVAGADPSLKASLLAHGISEALDTAAYGALGLLPPALAGVVLAARSRRAAR